MLDKHQSPPLMPDEQMINYEDFLKVAAVSSAKCKWEQIVHFLPLLLVIYDTYV